MTWREKVLCWNCERLVEIDTDDYYETEQEETMSVEYCSKCGKANAISYSMSPNFRAHEPSGEDLVDYGKEIINPEFKEVKE